MIKQNIFFVGLGNMGNPMAANLIKAGYPVQVFDLVREKADNLISMGATWAGDISPAQVAPIEIKLSAFSLTRSNTCTGYPALIRLAAMGLPILPKPTKKIFCLIIFYETPKIGDRVRVCVDTQTHSRPTSDTPL